jgi:hypothetical protein
MDMDTGFLSPENTFVLLAKGAFYGLIWDEGMPRPLTTIRVRPDPEISP